MRFSQIALVFALSAAVSGFATGVARTDELPELDRPVCSGYGVKQCVCAVTSCSLVEGKTRCSLECTFRWVHYA
jgi:hypothetical protein